VAAGIKTLEDYRTSQLQEEISDLKATCQMIVRTVRKHRDPIWMFVASTKCDLYAGDLNRVEDHYSPYGKNDFVRQLNSLQGQIGSLYFTWDALPVCGSLEDFEWNGELLPSALKPSQRDQLVTNLLRKIERACAR
jgi:hypothetical protein